MWDVKILGIGEVTWYRWRFTLTMWDVKQAESFFTDENGNSFTLTMWDVKRIYFTLPTKVIYRFTLTMWDVKPYNIGKDYKGYEFYLNYVGCKADVVQ